MAATQRHPKYWFLDGNIVFQADGTLFCLHQGVLFVHSPTLENIFTLPAGVANDGADEDHPIVLPAYLKVAHQLLHPYDPLAISALVEYVAQQANPDGLNLECKASFVNQVVESGGLEVEENIIYGAITAVEAYFNTL
ncbi:hypothetical protein EDC04DRAFT_2913266 [Pisolithus marmoratus]|nr:hypothetical protein EDC04DRAFT_2913266 [Pisolithus marmoratus]